MQHITQMLVIGILLLLFHEGSQAHYLNDGNSSQCYVEQQERLFTDGGDLNSLQLTEQAVCLYLGL